MNKILFLVLLSIVSYTGCGYKPTEPSGPGKTVPAKAGSTYVFKNVQTDTTGKAIDSTMYYSKDSVAEVGISYSGKSNVTHIANVDPASGIVISDTYYNFESNGDISIFVGGGGAGFPGITLPDWRTFPVQSHTTTGAKVADTTVTFQGFPLPIPLKAFDSTFYVNSGNYSVGSKNIPVYNSKEVLSFVATILFAPVTASTVTHIQFAPSLGYIVSSITDPTKSPVAQIPSFGGSEMTLTSYTLK